MPRSVILFGAGASHGLTEVWPEPPPLGGGLFPKLATRFPATWGSIPSDIREEFDVEGFEAGMAILWEDHSQVVSRLMQEMALYFIEFQPARIGSTEYGRLAAELVRNGTISDVLFSTLNYECILELAFAHHGLRPPIAKLHGSCNFRMGDMRAHGVSFTRGVSFDGGHIEAMTLGVARAHWRSMQSLPPVMSMYLRDKYSQTNQGELVKIQQGWAAAVREAENVVVVGVHPLPEDQHIWGPLADTQAKLTYVGDQAAFRRWSRRRHGGRGGRSCTPAATFIEGFDAVVSALCH